MSSHMCMSSSQDYFSPKDYSTLCEYIIDPKTSCCSCNLESWMISENSMIQHWLSTHWYYGVLMNATIQITAKKEWSHLNWIKTRKRSRDFFSFHFYDCRWILCQHYERRIKSHHIRRLYSTVVILWPLSDTVRSTIRTPKMIRVS